MNFDFNDDQRQIKETARQLLGKRSSFSSVRAAAEANRYDDALWSELCELGWPGIAISEERGGSGLGLIELVVLAEELGYAVTPSPFLSNAMAGLVIELAGSDEQRERWLPDIASGRETGTVASFRDGVAELVPDAAASSVIVGLEGGEARIVETGDAEIETIEMIDPTRSYSRVTHPGGEPLPGEVGAAVDACEAVLGAELVGLAQRALDLSVSYAKDRRQFDTPIGSYQAVSHKCAEMLLATEGARSAVYFAAWAADSDPGQLSYAASIAKSAAVTAAREVTADAIQIHGGVGFTWEADVHWLYKRALLDSELLSPASAAARRVAEIAATRSREAVTA